MAVVVGGSLDADLAGALLVIVRTVDDTGGGPTLRELAEGLFASVAYASKLYDLLEARGYVERRRNINGRCLARSVIVHRREFA